MSYRQEIFAVTFYWHALEIAETDTHTHSVLTAIFPGEPGLAGCPLKSPPFIPGLRILLGQT